MAYEIKYRSEDEMKDSGIEWLGKIPEDWGVSRIKDTASNKYKSFVDGDWIESNFITEDGIRLIQTGNIGVGKYREQGYRYISDRTFKTLNCTEVFENDILICRLAEPVGRACLAPKMEVRMITSVDVCILKPNIFAFNEYLVYALSNQLYLDYANMIARGGTRQRISRSQLGDIKIPIGQLIDQQKIANFLDIKTSEFDSIISKKEQLIEKLEEAKKSLISEVVTGKVKIVDGELVEREPEEMKDSGVEWLGMIPKDCEVKRINLITSNVGDGLHGTPIYEEGTKYFFINGNNLRNGKIIIDSSTKEVEKKEYNKYKKNLSENTILMSINGTIGNLAMYNGEKIILGKSAAYINLLKNINIQFIYYYFQSKEIEIYFNRSMSGTTINNLSLATIRKTSVVLPREEEMSYIVGYLDKRTSELELIIAKTKQQITKLKEAKQSLISEAVTGKIDLRDWEIIESGGR